MAKKKFKAEFDYAENDGFEISNTTESFEVTAGSLDEAIKEADDFLYVSHMTAYRNDYHTSYAHGKKSAEVTFGDSEANLSLVYNITEL